MVTNTSDNNTLPASSGHGVKKLIQWSVFFVLIAGGITCGLVMRSEDRSRALVIHGGRPLVYVATSTSASALLAVNRAGVECLGSIIEMIAAENQEELFVPLSAVIGAGQRKEFVRCEQLLGDMIWEHRAGTLTLKGDQGFEALLQKLRDGGYLLQMEPQAAPAVSNDEPSAVAAVIEFFPQISYGMGDVIIGITSTIGGWVSSSGEYHYSKNKMTGEWVRYKGNIPPASATTPMPTNVFGWAGRYVGRLVILMSMLCAVYLLVQVIRKSPQSKRGSVTR